MRLQEEMFKLITDTALNDDNIRAAYLEGSRVNPIVPKDIFQDYDIVYLVNSTKPYRENRSWIDRFGKRLYMQYPDEGGNDETDVENCYGWLMQLADGNRLDLHVRTKSNALENLELYRVLVDKDGIFEKKSNIRSDFYNLKKPTKQQFSCTCNEFWWCLNNVAKGLWRDEIPYAMDMLNFIERPMLIRILGYKIGAENDFSVGVGKSSKYMKKYLSPETYDRFLATYPSADKEKIWQAVITACELFDETAAETAEKLGYTYDTTEARNSFDYLKHVKNLPCDAKEVY